MLCTKYVVERSNKKNLFALRSNKIKVAAVTGIPNINNVTKYLIYLSLQFILMKLLRFSKQLNIRWCIEFQYQQINVTVEYTCRLHVYASRFSPNLLQRVTEIQQIRHFGWLK